jgi:hypothetical protein
LKKKCVLSDYLNVLPINFITGQTTKDGHYSRDDGGIGCTSFFSLAPEVLLLNYLQLLIYGRLGYEVKAEAEISSAWGRHKAYQMLKNP